MLPSYLTVPDTNINLAYHQIRHKNPKAHVLFLGGFRSNMQGSKALYLAQQCQQDNIDFVRFDYTGHGESDRAFESCTLSDWVRDAKAVLETLFDGKPVILVGSSMGGWISLLLARDCPQHIAGLVGVAAAPDFTQQIKAELTPVQHEEILSKGAFTVPCDYSAEPYTITSAFLNSGQDNLVLDRPLHLECPVRLLQGGRDTDVPVETVVKLVRHMECRDMQAHIIKGADHRFSRLSELKTIYKTLKDIISVGL